MSEWFPANSRIACSRQCTSTPLIYKEEQQQVTTDILHKQRVPSDAHP